MTAIKKIFTAKPTIEGAGVRLKRVFGFHEAGVLDPFLLLDHFGSDNPDDYLAGFPWHPHRGIETVTYMISGSVEHGDSLGNRGVINSGDVQWMTAGSGIIHQEMPRKHYGTMTGFQLWVNLPAGMKMMDPGYRGILSAEIPAVDMGGASVRLIAGTIGGAEGPVKDIVAEPLFADVSVPPDSSVVIEFGAGLECIAYVFEGDAFFDADRKKPVTALNLAGFGLTDGVGIFTAAGAARVIIAAGKPIGEPIAWRGPIVMNTDEELDLAFREYIDGTFIKKK
ncbi:MAG: pirin family protein [Spirochaetes bacterium]|jgi:hypothetical protein|nr:pirin family protein [Spirochaetota bacterium]